MALTAAERAAKYRAAHRDRVLASLKSYRLAHLEEERARNKSYRAEHRTETAAREKAYAARRRDHKRAMSKAYKAAHADELRARRKASWLERGDELRARCRAYRATHPAVFTAKAARRRADLATPSWADLGAVKAIYIEAARLTRETGVQYDVDHIIPLNSPLVCGLHVATNLQILPHVENVRKGRRFEVAA